MYKPQSSRPIWEVVGLVITGVFFILAGINHFRIPDLYAKIIPPGFPDPHLLVSISGAAEIMGGLGLLIAPLRRIAGWGLIALLIAIFPANVYMALNPGAIPGWHIPVWLLWLRLPLQGLIIAWVWWIVRLGRHA